MFAHVRLRSKVNFAAKHKHMDLVQVDTPNTATVQAIIYCTAIYRLFCSMMTAPSWKHGLSATGLYSDCNVHEKKLQDILELHKTDTVCMYLWYTYALVAGYHV